MRVDLQEITQVQKLCLLQIQDQNERLDESIKKFLTTRALHRKFQIVSRTVPTTSVTQLRRVSPR